MCYKSTDEELANSTNRVYAWRTYHSVCHSLGSTYRISFNSTHNPLRMVLLVYPLYTRGLCSVSVNINKTK